MRVLILLFLTLGTIFAYDLKLESKEEKTKLIELYTSQGCSSCPPADEWLSKLKKHPKLFEEFIPMAFHITYWNYIGWKDVFANVLNDNRQRFYAKRVWNNNSVYTPQFVIDSKEYREWFYDQSFPKLDKEYGGILKTNIKDNKVHINYFNKNIKNKKLFLNIAILGFEYKIDIKRGENKYKTLEHDFVVLNHVQKFTKLENNKLVIETKLPEITLDKKPKALAIWLSNKDYNILQAVGSYL